MNKDYIFFRDDNSYSLAKIYDIFPKENKILAHLVGVKNDEDREWIRCDMNVEIIVKPTSKCIYLSEEYVSSKFFELLLMEPEDGYNTKL